MEYGLKYLPVENQTWQEGKSPNSMEAFSMENQLDMEEFPAMFDYQRVQSMISVGATPATPLPVTQIVS